MMVGYAVGAALEVTDKSSPTLMKILDLATKLTEQFEKLKQVSTGLFSETGAQGLNRSLLTTEKRMGAVTAEVNNLNRSMKDLVAVSEAAMTRMTTIAESSGAIGAAAGGIGRAGSGGGGGGGGGRGGFWAGLGAGKIAGHAFEGAAALSGIGAWLDIGMRDFIARSLVTSQIPIRGDMMKMQEAQLLQNIIRQTVTTTGMSFHNTEEAALEVMRGLDPRSFKEKTAIMPGILQVAAVENRLKGMSMEEAAKSSVALAHQLQRYNPQQIQEILPAFTRLSMAAPGSMSAMTRALSYSLPFGVQGAGVDPVTLLAIAASGQQMNLNTKSGTWVDAMMKGLMPMVGGLTSHAQMKKLAGLEVLGLADHHGKSTVWDKQRDSLDLLKAFEILRDDRAKMPREVFAAAVQNAFITQGSRAALTWSAGGGLDNLIALIKAAKQQDAPEKVMAELSKNDPLVQLQISVAKMGDSLLSVGNKITNDLVPALNTLSNLLKSVTNVPGGSSTIATVAEGGAALWVMKKLGLLKVGGKIGGALLGAAGEGAAAGAGIEIGAGAVGMLGGSLLIGSMITAIIPIVVAGLVAYGLWRLFGGDRGLPPGIPVPGAHVGFGAPPGQPGGGIHGAHVGLSPAGAKPNVVHVHGPVTVQMPAGSGQSMMDDFAHQLQRSLTHSTSGQGSFQSPFLAGGGG